MAGDWIPIQVNLNVDPVVLRITRLLDGLVTDENHVVGLLVRFWAWVDQNMHECHAIGVTETFLDRYIGVPGFTRALVDVGWLLVRDDGIEVVDWDRWFSRSAKKRLSDARRQRLWRDRHAGRHTSVTPKRDKERYEKRDHNDNDNDIYSSSSAPVMTEEAAAAGALREGDLDRAPGGAGTNGPPRPESPSSGPDDGIVALLASSGLLGPDDAADLAAEPNADGPTVRVALANAACLRACGRLANPGGYLREAIRRRYPPLPEIAEAQAAQAAAERKRRDQAERHRKRVLDQAHHAAQLELVQARTHWLDQVAAAEPAALAETLEQAIGEVPAILRPTCLRLGHKSRHLQPRLIRLLADRGLVFRSGHQPEAVPC